MDSIDSALKTLFKQIEQAQKNKDFKQVAQLQKEVDSLLDLGEAEQQRVDAELDKLWELSHRKG